MAAAGPWVPYNEFKLALGNKLIDLDSDTLKIALFLDTSNAGSAALQTAQYATLTNQHGNQSGSGYLTGGATVASTWTGNYSAATKTLDTANASWTATGGSIVARFAVLYSDTATNKDLIAYCLLDSTPADVTVTTGNTLQITVSNIFTLA